MKSRKEKKAILVRRTALFVRVEEGGIEELLLL